MIENLLAEIFRAREISVFEEHKGTFQQRRCVAVFLLLHHNGLPDSFLCFTCVKYLIHAAREVLNKADLAHVIRLQYGQRFRQIVRVHIAIAREKELRPILSHQREEAAPFILDPDGIDVFSGGGHDDHDFCGIERREDIRLVFGSRLFLQCDARKEHSQPLLGELIVDLLRHQTVARADAVVFGFFIAYKDVERFFVL